jgi:hypothetical protein
MSDHYKEVLKRQMNRGLSDFGALEYTKKGILSSAILDDVPTIQGFLNDWQERGYLSIIRELAEASDSDVLLGARKIRSAKAIQ